MEFYFIFEGILKLINNNISSNPIWEIVPELYMTISLKIEYFVVREFISLLQLLTTSKNVVIYSVSLINLSSAYTFFSLKVIALIVYLFIITVRTFNISLVMFLVFYFNKIYLRDILFTSCFNLKNLKGY